MSYDVFQSDTGKPIKAWTKGVPIEDAARQQLFNLSELPFITGTSRPCRTCIGAWAPPWAA